MLYTIYLLGNCSIFNKYGHCSLDHPQNVHVIVSPPVRCSICTIPWPCNHCSYTADRKALIAAIAEIYARITRARQINVPDPPRSLVRHLRVRVLDVTENSLFGSYRYLLILLIHVRT